jgi:integration host factor subunit beta
MSTITKKDLIDQVAERTQAKRVLVKAAVETFFREIIVELAKGNCLEFRNFGVFEPRERAAKTAQNPKALERIPVPAKRVVKFKMGRLMKQMLNGRKPRASRTRLQSLGD